MIWRKTVALWSAMGLGVVAMTGGMGWVGFRAAIAPQEALNFIDCIAILSIIGGFSLVGMAYDELKGKC